MARTPLTCRCGWHFFITDATGGPEVACPSCGEGVAIPGRDARRPGPLTAGEIARASAQRQRTILLLAIAGTAIAAVAVALILLGGGGSGGDAPAPAALGPERIPRPPRIPDSPRHNTDLPPLPPIPPVETPGKEATQVTEENNRLAILMNLAVVSAEVVLRKSLAEEYSKIRTLMDDQEKRIKQNLTRLSDLGSKVIPGEYLAPGDRPIWVDGTDLRALPSKEVVVFLEGWLDRYPPPATARVAIQRGSQISTPVLQWGTRSPEAEQFISLARAVSRTGIPEPPPEPPAVDVPRDLIQEIEKRYAALPPGYRKLVPQAERERLEGLLGAPRKVFSSEIEFLRTRALGDILRACEDETRLIRIKIAELEPKARQTLLMDCVEFKDGRKLDGNVEDAGEGKFRLKGPVSGRFDNADVKDFGRGRGSGADFLKQLEEAKGKADKLALLAGWCRARRMDAQKEYVSYLALALDPANERTRDEVRLPKTLALSIALTPDPGTPKPADLSALNEGVFKRVDWIASQILMKTDKWQEVVEEMRKNTVDLQYGTPPSAPVKSAQAVVLMGDNPLKFNPRDLSLQTTVQLNNWWKNLTAPERREFALHFGLWCGYARYAAGGR